MARKKKIEIEQIEEDIITTDYCDEMSASFIDYAVSVITDRAIPDVRDGLKPVHRRILWAMKLLGLLSSGDYKKTARIVGETMGKFHPHGNTSIYDALVHMAQDWCYNHPLVDGHGNFGSVEGDDAAADRYTEAKLSPITEEILLSDLDKGVVDFIPNFDNKEKEPSVLPATVPNILISGTPMLLGVKDIILEWHAYRSECLKREIYYDLRDSYLPYGNGLYRREILKAR